MTVYRYRHGRKVGPGFQTRLCKLRLPASSEAQELTEPARIKAIIELAEKMGAPAEDAQACIRRGLDLAGAKEHLVCCGLNRDAASNTVLGARLRLMRAQAVHELRRARGGKA